MNQKLQQAIVAARAGRKREAQLLLAQLLQDNPQEVHAWYLLSLLVESPEKQRAYLGKVLALDPDHEKARQQLSGLQKVTPIENEDAETAVDVMESEVAETEVAPLSQPASVEADFMAQERGDTLPDWLADDLAYLNLDQAELKAMSEAVTTDTPEEVDVPDWLQEGSAGIWSEAEEAAWAEDEKQIGAEQLEEAEQPTEVTTESQALPPSGEQERAKPEKPQQVPAAKPRSGRDDQRRQEVWLTRFLIGLIAVAAVIFALLVYVIATTF